MIIGDNHGVSGMGFNVNANDKFKEFFTRSAGEKHDDMQISKDIKEYAAQMGIKEEDLVRAIDISIWTPSGNPFSEGIEGISAGSEGGNSIDSMLEAARQRKIAILSTNSGSTPAAFGNLTSAAPVQESETATSQVDTVIVSSQNAATAAQETVSNTESKGKQKENNAQRSVNSAELSADTNNTAANINVNKAKTDANKTQLEGDKNISSTEKDVNRENEKAKSNYESARAEVFSLNRQYEESVNLANEQRQQNNKTAEEGLTSAKQKKDSTTKTITDIEGEISAADEKINTLLAATNSPDATEEDMAKYNEAVEEKKKLEAELEKAKTEDEAAKKLVTEAESNVETVKKDGETLVQKAGLDIKSKIKKAEAAADNYYTEMTSTENKGKQKIENATNIAKQNNQNAQAAVAKASAAAEQTKTEGKKSVASAEKKLEKTQLENKKAVADAQKKADEIKKDGSRAVSNAKMNEQSAGEQPVHSSTTAFAQSLTGKSADNEVVMEIKNNSELKATNEEQNTNKILKSLEHAENISHRPLGDSPEIVIRHAAEKVARRQGTEDGLSEKSAEQEYPLKNKPRTFGI